MKKIWKPLILVLIVGTLAASLYSQVSSRDDTERVSSLEGLSVGIMAGEVAPDFTGTTLDGDTIRLSDFRGRIVLINGEQLSQLMIDYNVGVTPVASYELKKIDFDYFLEE